MFGRFAPVFLGLFAAVSAWLPAVAEPPSVRRAVLIGINDYMTSEFGDLRGAVNDVIAMRELLIGRFGFEDGNVKVLTDGAATREAILKALNDLAAQASENDVVYVHYSGHGSQVQDVSGDEPDDHKDETILPHDARTGDVPDITDDELGEFLNRLQAATAVIVLDSCHSGTATRGGIVTRSVPADTRVDLYRRPNDGVATRDIVQLEIPERYVLMTGAASNQSALDGPVNGKYYGFFSYALSQGLGTVDLGASPRVLHASIQQTFSNLSEQFGGVRLPEPQFEAAAALLDQPLFPVVGRVASNPLAATIEPDSPASRALEVRWDQVDIEMQAQLETLLKERLPQIEFAAMGEFARFVIDVIDGRCKVHGAAGLTVVDEFEIESVSKTAERLAGVFGRSLKASQLTAMTNSASSLRVKARVVGADGGEDPRIKNGDEPRSPRTSLMLEIETNRDSYLTIVDVDAEGGVNLLFPNSYTSEGFLPEGFVRAGQAQRIPDSLDNGNRAGFHWDYQPPAGQDTIQVFAATDLQTAETIRKWLGETPAVATRSVTGGGPAGLERFERLREALNTRGVGVVRDQPAAGMPEVADMPPDPGMNEVGDMPPMTDAMPMTDMPPMPGAQPPSDWNAISLRIRVTE